MIAYTLPSTNPANNLALEDVLFSQIRPDSTGCFLLWHNAPSIIVGKHQNTQGEINAALVERYALPVVRRQTGGGAVYHDLGNLNFSFLVPDSQRGPLDFKRFLLPVRDVLHSLGVQAELSSRNDLTVAGKKISGSAQLRNKYGILHHGTLLVSLDMDMLGAVLTGAPDKFLSKGIASVRSRVTNIAEHAPAGVDMDVLKHTLLQGCAHETGQLDASVYTAAEALAAVKYSTWDWNYGASPPFNHRWRQRFDWGALEVCYAVTRGHVQSCRLFGDYFSQADVAELEHTCVGLAYERSTLLRAWADVDLTPYFNGCDAQQVREFLCAEV